MPFPLRLFSLPILMLTAVAVAVPFNPDSLRHEAGALAAEGKLDAALALVENSLLPSSSSNLLQGKLELKGDAAQKNFEAVAKDPDAATATRGEALFRLGQLHYAAGRYRQAIPQFREYLTGYPKGSWADPAAYWMAYSCLQYALQTPRQKTYLDSSLHYVDRLLKTRNASAYYRPMALTARARTLLARGSRSDTIAAFKALDEARRQAPPEETPGVYLLSSTVPNRLHDDAEKVWEDSLLWNYPFSPEAGLVTPSHKPAASRRLSQKAAVKNPSPATSPRYTLQLGYFSVARNAEEMRKGLAKKGIQVRMEKIDSGKRPLFRVSYGDFPNPVSAHKEGLRLFKPIAYAYQITSFNP